jgi:hypothetical protein
MATVLLARKAHANFLILIVRILSGRQPSVKARVAYKMILIYPVVMKQRTWISMRLLTTIPMGPRTLQ